MEIEIIVILCLVGMVAFGLCMAMFRSMLKAAICLACASACLSIAMFIMGAVWAGVFELSVCSGLITVIFISAISVTKENKDETKEQEKENRENVHLLPLILIVVGVVLIAIVTITNFNLDNHAAAQEVGTFSEILWTMRQSDMLGQLIMILTGAFTIVVLFKERGKK